MTSPNTPPTRAEVDRLRRLLLDAALAYADLGWHVFPLRPGEKRPAVSQWEQRATTDPARIRRCWATGPFNIGIATGPSGLVVIDPDVPKPGAVPPPEWQEEGVKSGRDTLVVVAERAGVDLNEQFTEDLDTYTVNTPSGGMHLYYQHPADGPQLRNTAGTLGWLIDTRAHGGYVVAAGSITPAGLYTVAEVDDDPTLRVLPAWLATRLAPRPLPPQEPVTIDLPADRAGTYLRAAVDRTVADLRAAPGGQRNRALYGAAVSLGQLVAGGALGADEVTALLAQVAGEIGQRPSEAARTIRSGLTAGAKRPRSVAA
ncbi:bifunctional DNA primase/polymerase [Cryptosporangium sp. NPDC051539]|uniref:bifunctional DNA primase/polymerase n=1 Tax=Cryptosporangium sp. NPDC051539 TaxID=3363962 RepID=UPI0037875733